MAIQGYDLVGDVHGHADPLHRLLDKLVKVVSEAIDILRSDQYIAPRQLWEVGLRLFEKVQQSGFRKSLAPLLRACTHKSAKSALCGLCCKTPVEATREP